MLNDLGITYPQYLVLLTLWQDGPSTMRRIAERMKVSPNAITPLVDRLVDEGLVTRDRSEKDRREIVIALTKRGTALERDASVVQSAVECQTDLDPDALAELRDELISLTERMKQSRTLDSA